MFELIVGILLIPAGMIIFLRVGRTIRDMLVYSTDLSVSKSAKLPVSIIKPVYGAHDYTEENFRSWTFQDYEGAVETIYSFQDANDPALPIAKGMPGHPVVLVNPVKPGYSGKMPNLHFGLKAAQYEFVVMSDSDTRADPKTLKRIVALREQGAEFITNLTRYRYADNLWARIYAAFWNYEQIRFLAPAIREHGRGAIGNTIVMSNETLRKLCGLESFRDYVAEDVAVGAKSL